DAAGAVNREEVAFAERLTRGLDGLGRVINVQRAGTADADLAHLARDEGRVRTDAALGRQNAFGGDHAAQVFGRSFVANEQNLLALFSGDHGAVGVEIEFAGSRARAGGQTGGNGLGF